MKGLESFWGWWDWAIGWGTCRPYSPAGMGRAILEGTEADLAVGELVLYQDRRQKWAAS